jgi:hypothetical protein
MIYSDAELSGRFDLDIFFAFLGLSIPFYHHDIGYIMLYYHKIVGNPQICSQKIIA